jgi:PBP1b-binding outer membrane lipoprotein LpoB
VESTPVGRTKSKSYGVIVGQQFYFDGCNETQNILMTKFTYQNDQEKGLSMLNFKQSLQVISTSTAMIEVKLSSPIMQHGF